MDKNSLLSTISFIAVYVYLYIGFYTFNQNRKSKIHRIFLLLCTCYAIWSFSYGFAYISNNNYQFAFWNKISALGWCNFSALVLYTVLLITENNIIKNWTVNVLIFMPAAVFLYMAVFLFGADIKTSDVVTEIFYIGDFLYNFIYLFISIVLLYLWGLRSKSTRIKKQSRILVITSITPFILNLLTQTIIPALGIVELNFMKDMGQIYSLIMIIGTYIVITKYKLLKIPEKFIVEEVIDKIVEMVIILNENGEFVKVSKNTLEMLGYENEDLINKNISHIFLKNDMKRISINNMKQDYTQFNDVFILKKTGEKIPVNILCIGIFDSTIHDFLGVALIMQDISMVHELREKNKQLHEKSIRDSLTNLYNHQYVIDIIKEEVDKAKKCIDGKELSLMMIDIDYFKKVNDTYGHQFGDSVLKTVSNILLSNISEKGFVGRFGGEEFIIVLPKTGINEAYNIGEKIRGDIENYIFNNNYRITISMGIKQLNNESYTEFVKNVDDLLYKAKESGRNKIEFM